MSHIDGVYYILTQEEFGPEYVSRYSETEMDQCFSAGERVRLANGETVVQRFGRNGRYINIDMVVAARAARR